MKCYIKLEEVIVHKGDYYNWQANSLQQITEYCIENKESADAEKYYALLYDLEIAHGAQSTTANAKISRILAETSIEFFNMYILDKKLSNALEVFETLKKLEKDLLEDAAIYYSRAVYALCCYYSKNGDINTAIGYSHELKRLTGYENTSEYIDNYSGTLYFILSAYDAQGDKTKADNVLAEFEKLSEESGRETVASRLAEIYYNRVVYCFADKDYKSAYVYFQKLEKQLSQFNREVPDLAENYMDVATKYANLYTKSKNISSLTKLYDTIDKAPITPKHSQKEYIMSFILYSLSTLEEKPEKVEQLVEQLKLMAEQSYASADTILRIAKSTYNIHYDYSDSGNFEKAEAHYQYLKSLYAKYADSDYTVDDNPLGLEIAFRLATAALNYSIDYKNKVRKSSIFSFKNKSLNPSEKQQILIDDVSLLTEKWTGEEAKPLHDNLAKMKQNL